MAIRILPIVAAKRSRSSLNISWIASSLTLLAMTMFCFSSFAYPWKKIDEGLHYSKIHGTDVVQIDPKQFKFAILTTQAYGLQTATVENLAKASGALLAINGGFFNPERESLGLIVNAGKRINPLHTSPWWAIFQIQNQEASIFPYRFFQLRSNIEMALQVGPRLLVKGSIPKLKPSLARRSGIGIQKGGNVILATTDLEISLQDFAKLFQTSLEQGGFGCMDALNLDGGGSTQLYINWQGFQKNIRGTSFIPNAIAIFKR